MASKKKTRTSKGAASKRTAAKKKTTRKKTAAKPAARKKTAAKRGTKKKASTSRLSIDELSSGAERLMLANLGLYGTVLDELQEQLSRAKSTVQKARKNPDAANKQLVARGEKLVKQVRDLMKASGAPATKQLNKQINDLRDSLKKLRKKVSAS